MSRNQSGILNGFSASTFNNILIFGRISVLESRMYELVLSAHTDDDEWQLLFILAVFVALTLSPLTPSALSVCLPNHISMWAVVRENEGENVQTDRPTSYNFLVNSLLLLRVMRLLTV